MMRARLFLAFFAVASSFRGYGQPVGAEFRVNGYTTGDQRSPAVAESKSLFEAPDKGFVVVWQSDGQDGDANGVFARVFDSSGTSAAAFRVNDYTTGDQKQPAVAAGFYGEFEIAWVSYGQVAGGDIFVRRYDSSASSLGGGFVVNTHTTGSQFNPSIAMDGGTFIVVWYDASTQEVLRGDFSVANGSPSGGFPVDYGLSTSTNTDIARSRLSATFETWTRVVSGDRDIFGHIGVAQPSFRVNSYTSGNQLHPRVAGTVDDATFVVVWQSPGQDGDGAGVFGQLYTFYATPIGVEFRVNSYTTGDQQAPSVAFDGQASFVVVWESVGRDGSGSGVYGRRFDSTGGPLGGEFRVNSTTTGDQSNPVISASGNGKYVVSWESAGQDGDGFGVYAQQFCRPLQSVTITLYDGVPVCSGTFYGGIAGVVDDGGGVCTHEWGYRTSPGGATTLIPGATFSSYSVKGSDFPSSPGTYYLVCKTTPECGVITYSNVAAVTIIAPGDDMTPPGVLAPLTPVVVTQTLCQ